MKNCRDKKSLNKKLSRIIKKKFEEKNQLIKKIVK